MSIVNRGPAEAGQFQHACLYILVLIVFFVVLSAHSTHLAVTDFLYKQSKKKKQKKGDQEDEEDDEEDGEENNEDDEVDGAEGDWAEEDEEAEDDLNEEEEVDEADVLSLHPPDVMLPELKPCWKSILDLARGIVSFFKPYPLRRDILRAAYNEVLQEKEDAKKEKARLVQLQKERAKARMQLLRKSRRQVVDETEEEPAGPAPKEKEPEPEKEKQKEPKPAGADEKQKEKDITLVLDVPTRWNSSPAMLDSIIKMKEALIRAGKKGPLKGKFTLPTDQEWAAIDNLRAALIPMEILTKFLCAENVSILRAEVVFQGAFNALSSLQDDVARQLKKRLEKRYKERRNVNILSILTFTLSPQEYSRKVDKYDLLEVSMLREEITMQYDRLFPAIDEVDSDMEIDEEVVDDPTEPEAESHPLRVTSDMERMMQQFFTSGQDFVQPVKEPAKLTLDTISDEVTRAFETGEVMERLKRLESALLALPASSVECERAFSTIGVFHSKIRNRLNDSSLDYLSFGKHFLRNEKKKK